MIDTNEMGAAMKVAETLARSQLIPDKLKGKPADVLVVLLTGRELGLQPMQALRSIYVWNGVPTMSADLMQAICLSRRDVCAKFQQVESTADRATYEAQRVGGEAVRLSWTKTMANAAGLLSKGTWKQYPEAMLRARCKAALARDVFPDLMAGLYTPEEVDAEDVAAPAPVAKEKPALPPPAPRETLTFSTEREKAPIPRMTLEEAQNAPPGSIPGVEVIITDLPPREPGSDDGEPDPIEKEGAALIAICERATKPEEVQAIRPRALKLPPNSPERTAVGEAMKKALERTKAGAA